jgi:rhamnulokinase
VSGQSYLACDLGAESGRVILGSLQGGRLELKEIHRFPTGAVKIQGTLRWNLLRIFEELKLGLRLAAKEAAPVSLSVDSWGVDYVLCNDHEPMLGIPRHYRDARNDAAFARAVESAGAEFIFAETGIQFMAINTLYQLLAEQEENPQLLAQATRFLPIADYLHYLLCGVAGSEESLASTTQLYDPAQRGWSTRLIRHFGLPERIFPEIVPSATRLGPLLPELQEETGLPALEVIATCSHDTGAAVVAVPAEGEDWAFISSGTWSLLGAELPRPLISEEVRAHNFTNEAGFGGTTRFLKNIVGLWLLQECQRTWQKQGQAIDYGDLNRQATEAEPFRSLIDPRAPAFLKPDGMPEKIADFCRATNQPVPGTPGQYARCIFESLALLYRAELETLGQLTGRAFSRLHIVGGGSRSTLLNQLTADAIGRPVLSGPVEATAIGNVLVQAIALGELSSLAAARQAVRDSFPIRTLHPRANEELPRIIARFDTVAALFASAR